MRKSILILCLGCLLAATGCVHKVSIQQGNYLHEDTVSRVEEGMTRDQVKFLLGTPMADDPFSNDRWDYVYYFSNGRTGEVFLKRLAIYFDGDSVSRIDSQEG